MINELELLNLIKTEYQKILSDKLVGIYIHGSIAFGCFNFLKSDIDFLVVINKVLSLDEKKALIKVLSELNSKAPAKGFEMSVVLEKVCNPFEYPTPFELHFSNAHKESCRDDLEGYCLSMKGEDKDLAAHFTVVKKAGIVLCGKETGEVFGVVPKEYYIDSIMADVSNAVDEVCENPIYIILNLCRVLAVIKEDLVLSKEQGGRWGIDKLPIEYHPLIISAVNSYCCDAEFEADDKTCREFAKFMLKEIRA